MNALNRRVHQRGFRCAFGLAAVLAAWSASATTWNEPWHKEVVAKADTFGLFEVERVDGHRATLRPIKILAGAQISSSIELDGYYQLQVASTSSFARDDELHLPVSKGDRVYVFAKAEKGHWQTATPTAGIDVAPPDRPVHATYRISFMQALQPADAYELVESCIFRKLHHGSCEVTTLAQVLDYPLREPPAMLSPTATPHEQQVFFAQHVALESAYLLERSLPVTTLEPFLQSPFFHQQLAAVRALSVSKDPSRNARLVAFVSDPTRTPVAQVMAVLMAKEVADAALIGKLKLLARTASTKTVELPINIMDPRVATVYPSSVSAAIASL